MNRKRFATIASSVLMVIAIAFIWRLTAVNTQPMPHDPSNDANPTSDAVRDTNSIEDEPLEMQIDKYELLHQFHDAPIKMQLNDGQEIMLPVNDPEPLKRFHYDKLIDQPLETDLGFSPR